MNKGNTVKVEQALEELFSPARMPAAFPALESDRTRGIIACEHQGASGAKRGWHDVEMLALQQTIQGTFMRADIRRGLPRERKFKKKMGKYGMQHAGLQREQNKREAVRIVRYLCQHCFHALALLAVLDAAADARENEHDLCDAFLLALQAAEKRARKGKEPFPIRAIGIDPGTRNLGVCVLDVISLSQRDPRPDGSARAPLPVIRVLYWALVDLEEPDAKQKLPYTIKVALAEETPVYLPPPPLAARDDEMARELSFQVNRQQAARKRANAKAKEKRASKKQKV